MENEEFLKATLGAVAADGVTMVCAESPVSLLLVGTDGRLLDVVEDALISAG